MRRSPGSLGKVTVTEPHPGHYRARARVVTRTGRLKPIQATAETEADAIQALRDEAERYGLEEGALTNANTLADALAVWLEDVADAGRVQGGTLADYRRIVRTDINTRLGMVKLRDLTPGLIHRELVKALVKEKTPAAAAKARSVLMLALKEVVLDGVLVTNPVRDVPRPKLPKKRPFALDAAQLRTVMRALAEWREGEGHPGPKGAGVRVRQVFTLQLATSMRIGEVMALTRGSVDVTTSPARITVEADVIFVPRNGRTGEPGHLERKPWPKDEGQIRVLALPEFGAEVLRTLLAQAGPGDDAPLFTSRTGGLIDPNNVQRDWVRIRENSTILKDELPDEVRKRITSHVMRKTVATHLAKRGGIELAQRQLGHADHETTAEFYYDPPTEVSPLGATFLQELWDDAN